MYPPCFVVEGRKKDATGSRRLMVRSWSEGLNEVLMGRSTAREAIQRGSERALTGASKLFGFVASLVLVSGAANSGCVAAATAPPTRVIVVTGPPPAPITEELTPQPQSASVWIAGYWHWTGIQYAWIPGHWEASPRAGAVWQAPRYTKSEGSYLYEPGTWWNGRPPPQANAFR